MPFGPHNGMPGTGRSLSERLNRVIPALSVGAVKKVQVINGRVYVDVDDLTSANYHRTCPLMVFGGGPDNFMVTPVTETPDDRGELNQPPLGSAKREFDHEVILVHRANGKPYAIGMAPHPDMTIQEELEEDPGAADHGAQISKKDHAIRNTGALFLVDANGAITLDTQTSGQRVRVQLKEEGGRFRVSRGGEADERVILADAFLDGWVNGDLKNHLQAQNDRITQLEADLAQVIAVLSPGLPVAGSLATPAAGSLPAVTTNSQTPPEADDSHKSGTVELASTALSEE